MADYVNNDVAMTWDDSIENDNEFVLLPEGDYDFTITKFERKRFAGSAKMSACPQASLTIKLFNKANPSVDETTVNHNLFLNLKCEGILCAFFTAIGDRKHGEKLKPNWNAIIGKGGRCKVNVREWVGSDGSPKKSNEIVKFYEPANTPSPVATPTYTPGQF